MVAGGFMLFSLGLILIIVIPIVAKKNARCSAQAEGVLTDKIIGDAEKRNTYFYSYHVDGIEYKLKTVDRSPQTNNIGDQCIIWYNPAKPKEALAFRYETNKVFNILLIIGIVFFIGGIVLFLIGL
ncbi:MAG: DUF3592 domain-containing protein [Lachnospiraceae bacterium]|nr:DUF3592 domain-containing protein [Lachnospiraceae bacterium]